MCDPVGGSDGFHRERNERIGYIRRLHILLECEFTSFACSRRYPSGRQIALHTRAGMNASSPEIIRHQTCTAYTGTCIPCRAARLACLSPTMVPTTTGPHPRHAGEHQCTQEQRRRSCAGFQEAAETNRDTYVLVPVHQKGRKERL